MNRSIVSLIKSGEGERVEYKQSLSERKQILEAISAFSNTSGGTILIGIDPTGRINGVTIGANTLENLANEIKQNTDPKVYPSIEAVSVQKKTLITVRVQESPLKPVWTVNKVFIRVGRTNQRASADKITRMIQESQPFTWDQHIPQRSKISDIDAQRVRVFYRTVEAERNTYIEGSKSVASILSKFHLLIASKPTAAAILLFAKNPQSRFIQTQVRCARFKGNQTDEFLDMKTFSGTIIEQVPEALTFIQRHVNVSAVVTGKAERKED